MGRRRPEASSQVGGTTAGPTQGVGAASAQPAASGLFTHLKFLVCPPFSKSRIVTPNLQFAKSLLMISGFASGTVVSLQKSIV